MGTAKQTSKPSNCGRHAMLLARLPEKIPAYTVQRQSASGLQAVANGYWAIRCGDAGAVLAGGTESMSQIPFEIRHARYAFTGKERAIIDAIPAQETGAQPVEKYGVLTAAERAEHFCPEVLFFGKRTGGVRRGEPAEGPLGGWKAACSGRSSSP